MKFNFDPISMQNFSEDLSEQRLEILPKDWEEVAGQLNSQSYSNEVVQQTARLNYLTINKFKQYFESVELSQSHRLAIGLFDEHLYNNWGFFNGSMILLDDKVRLALIPAEMLDSQPESYTHYNIPQEWMDISPWAVHYYLFTQVNIDEQWLQISGYASYETIRQKATFDPNNRVFCLNQENLIQNIETLWIRLNLIDLYPLKIPDVADPKALSKSELDELLAQLSQPTSSSPRLAASFEQWAGFISNQAYRNRLKDTLQSRPKVAAAEKVAVERVMARVVEKLSDLFQRSSPSVADLIDPAHPFAFARPAKSPQKVQEVVLGDQKVILVREFIPSEEDPDEIIIHIQVLPEKGQTTLPLGLRVSASDISGGRQRQVVVRAEMSSIHLPQLACTGGETVLLEFIYGNESTEIELEIDRKALEHFGHSRRANVARKTKPSNSLLDEVA